MKKTNRKNTELMLTVGKNIRLKREQLGMNQADLDKQTELRTYKYESGETDLTLTTLSIFCKALKVKMEDLLYEQDTVSP